MIHQPFASGSIGVFGLDFLVSAAAEIIDPHFIQADDYDELFQSLNAP